MLYKITYNSWLPLDCALVKENKKIPPATVKRLPLYLQCLDQVDNDSVGISSRNLAELAKVNDAQVRRDLSYLHILVSNKKSSFFAI